MQAFLDGALKVVQTVNTYLSDYSNTVVKAVKAQREKKRALRAQKK